MIRQDKVGNADKVDMIGMIDEINKTYIYDEIDRNDKTYVPGRESFLPGR